MFFLEFGFFLPGLAVFQTLFGFFSQEMFSNPESVYLYGEGDYFEPDW